MFIKSAKKLLDVTLQKAQELGYDDEKPRIKEARVSIPLVK